MRRRTQGHAALEYLLIVALVVVVLWSGPDDPIGQSLEAIRSRYVNFLKVLYQP